MKKHSFYIIKVYFLIKSAVIANKFSISHEHECTYKLFFQYYGLINFTSAAVHLH